MANPAMVSGAVAALGLSGIGAMYVMDKKQQAHTHEQPSLLKSKKSHHEDGFRAQLTV